MKEEKPEIFVTQAAFDKYKDDAFVLKIMDMLGIKVGNKDQSEAVDYVVCGKASSVPLEQRDKGSVEVECHACKTLVILSPSSPVKPPKLCPDCALEKMKEADAGEQSLNE